LNYLSIDEVKESDFDAILILGGRAPEYLRHHTKLLNLVQEFHQRGKWVWAICHGIQVLINAGLAAGNCLTCYEHVRSEVERNGGTYSTLEAVRDKNIVTAQTWQSHPEFYREIFNCLAEKK
jgi:protease I